MVFRFYKLTKLVCTNPLLEIAILPVCDGDYTADIENTFYGLLALGVVYVCCDGWSSSYQ
ncbi:hypothetical protein AQPE_3416 [Aquipluma nitroreducens]|uniref:Uncharacterized protein n=1 Tax=Aquipluma nitroreducens TaxID=2010828 RepID=A0A5K7SCD9_9BACT|nr:hypothetical protein [Aquipluma nitroreducens]BBE19240.1 hypothetical protein AQPE_3416 [Aquipluma nitroreducens]